MPNMTVRSALAAALVCAPVVLVAQNKAATYITTEQVDTVNKQPGTDRTSRVLGIGHAPFAVGTVRLQQGRLTEEAARSRAAAGSPA